MSYGTSVRFVYGRGAPAEYGAHSFCRLLDQIVLQTTLRLALGIQSVRKGFTDETTVDTQVQELKNLLGVARSLDEGSLVEWWHWERCGRLARALWQNV